MNFNQKRNENKSNNELKADSFDLTYKYKEMKEFLDFAGIDYSYKQIMKYKREILLICGNLY